MTEEEIPETNQAENQKGSEKAPPPPAGSDKEQLEAELSEYKNKYLRLLADMENARKRLQKEKQELMRYGIENVLSEILTPMDNLENALKHAQKMSGEVKTWATGFQMILAQLKDVLSQHGVVAFQSEGTPFDPHLHEAVETEETEEYPEGTVIQEFVKGYKCGDRTLRPARVKVSKTTQKKDEKTIKDEEN